jgi:hypothetical protein
MLPIAVNRKVSSIIACADDHDREKSARHDFAERAPMQELTL